MIVYSGACSFGIPVGTSRVSYNRIISDELSATLVTNHVHGSSNRRIIRSSVRDLIELKKDNGDEKILALIGLSFIFRMELWQPNLPATSNDGHFHPIRMVPRKWQTKKDYYIGDVDKECNSVIDPDIKEWYRQQLIWQDKESLVVETLTDIIMFSSFCQQQDIRCQIWNNADLWPDHPHVNCQDVFLKSLVDHATKSTALIDPWKFAFLPWSLEQGLRPIDEEIYGDYGHPGPEAHERLAYFLLSKIKE